MKRLTLILALLSFLLLATYIIGYASDMKLYIYGDKSGTAIYVKDEEWQMGRPKDCCSKAFPCAYSIFISEEECSTQAWCEDGKWYTAEMLWCNRPGDQRAHSVPTSILIK